MPYKDKNKQREASKHNYLKNKQKYLDSRTARKRRNKEYVYSKKTSCEKCGLEDKVCLEFHHVDDKEKNVSQLIMDAASIERVENEINKCRILCSNCHRKEHISETLVDGSNWKYSNHRLVEKRKWFIEYVKTVSCMDCQENDRRCLDFHHLRDKSYTVAYLITSGHSLDFLKKEIEKCVVVCSNCHKKRHKTW